MTIQSDDFEGYFLALHGHRPFPWQRRLAERVASHPWPEVLDLPTASGKTACIDIALFGLACQASRPASGRTAPRRLFFVVDRRIIVDAAYRRALAIAARLRTGIDAGGRPSPILSRVAAALRSVGGADEEEEPIDCAQLRGGVYRDQAWARSATRPTIIASTVDQVGSRLLFRGYGMSDSLAPIHAALVGNDALILLDEAHCALPFLQTARAIRDYRLLAAAGTPIMSPFQVAVLSATPPREGVRFVGPIDSFGLGDEDRLAEHLGPRLSASKPAELIEPINATFRPGSTRDKFAEALSEHARRLAGSGDPRTVVVFANRVDTARAVHRELQKRAGDADVVLMIGRMRPIDRDRLVEAWVETLRSGADRSGLERTVFVVATQCLEVGADFDFDVLVTEAASLDALRQRFGRLNRLGRRDVVARAAILARSDQVKDGAKPDPIYGEALAETWRWLLDQADRLGDESIIDFGIDALSVRLPDDPEALAKYCAPAPDAPVMLPAHLDCWVQTAPRPAPDPDPALFLHGPGRDRPEVQVCWRADLGVDLEDDVRQRRWVDAVSLCPPVAAECMSVPLHLVRSWLIGQEQPADDDGDVEHAALSKPDDPSATDSRPRLALRWAGPDNDRTAVVPHEGFRLRPGDTLVLPADAGGWEFFGHIPDAPERPFDPTQYLGWGTAVDVAEHAYLCSGRQAVLRLHPRLMEGWPAGEPLGQLLRIARESEDPAGEEGAIRDALRALSNQGSPGWLARVALTLAEEGERRLKVILHPDHRLSSGDEAEPGLSDPSRQARGGLVLIGTTRLKPDRPIASGDDTSSEDDTASGDQRPVPLVEHCRDVAETLDRDTELLGLPGSLATALRTTALLHDIGKADRRFQAVLHGGNRRAASQNPQLLAKSSGLSIGKEQRELDRERAGWPRGGRHELLSVRLVEPILEGLDPAIDRELVLHLIAAHHGHARPFAPFAEGLEPGDFPGEGDHHGRQIELLAVAAIGPGAGLTIPMANAGPGLHRLESGVAERFWNLVRRYGWWNLAWYEALLRLADHHVSARP